MAGRPQARRRREAAAAAAADGVPDADVLDPNAPARDARTPRPRAGAQARLPQQRVAPGPKTKDLGDRTQADAAAELAAMLTPGITVTIDRIKPNWCAGWQEDYLLDSDDIGELRQYIKDEYGGQIFRLTAMAAGGAPLWVSKMTIGGKPREDGRTLRRWEYEGESNPAAQQARPAAAAPPDAAGLNIMGVLSLVLESNRDAAAAQLAAVRETVTSSNKAIENLMTTIVVERGEEKRGGDFAGQLKSLVESTKALKKAGSFFGAAEGGPAQTSGSDGMLSEAAKHAMERFVVNVVDSEMGDGPKRPQRVRRPAPDRRPAGGGDGIPDAIRRPSPSN